MNKSSFTYSVLRYVHDTSTGEFANVGVVLLCPELRYADAILSPTCGRLTQMFPGMDKNHYREVIRHLQARFDMEASKIREELDYGTPETAEALATSVIGRDDNSFQWSPMGSGICGDPAEKLEAIFHRMVTRYENQSQSQSRNDDQIWRGFKTRFEERKILSRFTTKVIESRDLEVEFSHAWKNQQWHCMEALSFDLMQGQSIKDKANTWLGRITSIKESREPFKVYYLVGEPQLESSKRSFEQALNILHMTPVEHDIVREHEAADFSKEMEAKIEAHDREAGM